MAIPKKRFVLLQSISSLAWPRSRPEGKAMNRIPTKRPLHYRVMCALGELADRCPWLMAAVAVIAVYFGNK